MANSNNKLKAYVRYDGNGRVIPGSLILQRFKPKVGNWQEIDANECCNDLTTTTTTSTSTSTTTTTTTAAPGVTTYGVSPTGYADRPTACAASFTPFAVYAASSNPASVTQFFNDSGLTVPHTGDDTSYYTYFVQSNPSVKYTANISSTIGEVLSKAAC